MIDPRTMTVQSWTAFTIPLLTQFGMVPKLENAESWRKWAASVCSLPGLSGVVPPRPQEFPDWRSWAAAFNQSVGNLIGFT